MLLDTGHEGPSAKKRHSGIAFISASAPQDHFESRRSLLAAHPQLRSLTGTYRPTALVVVVLVVAQVSLAFFARGLPWWGLILLAYTAGAVLAHALYVMIHEATHDLVFKRPWANKALGILANLPTALPSAISFRKYHILHHLHLGEVDFDADLPSRWERRLVRGSPLSKALWLLSFPIVQALRPARMARVRLWDRWTVVNMAVVFAGDLAIVWILGPGALVYLVLSTLFGLGLHPLGARWIQEHFVLEPGQETYSCYSRAGNLLAFNVGYHVEHHDFMNVAWVRLPRIRKVAPDRYQALASYSSWTGLLRRFLVDRRLSACSRLVRET
jgi:sphingolipid delta-4 desaturase